MCLVIVETFLELGGRRRKRHLREGSVFGRQALRLLHLCVQLGEQLVSGGLQAANLALQRLRGGSVTVQGGDLAAGRRPGQLGCVLACNRSAVTTSATRGTAGVLSLRMLRMISFQP